MQTFWHRNKFSTKFSSFRNRNPDKHIGRPVFLKECAPAHYKVIFILKNILNENITFSF